MKMKRRGCILFSLTGFLFFFCCLTGGELARKGNIIWNKGYTAGTIAVSLALGIIVGCTHCLLLLKWEERGRRAVGDIQRNAKLSRAELPSPGVMFFLSLACILLCWLPGYLAYYPGICAYDCTIQLGQISEGMYNEHHPLAHTLLLELFLKIGGKIGNVSAGIGLYTAFQVMVLAASMAGVTAALRAWSVKKAGIIFWMVFCCLFPLHWYMSVTVTKDVYFTAFMLLQLLMLCGVLRGVKEGIYFDGWDLGYLFFSVLMILFRNNGRYAMAVLAAVLLASAVFGKKCRKQCLHLLADTAAGIVAGSILLVLVSHAVGAQQGDKREMLSIPIQQLARCMVYHGGIGELPEDDATISEEDKELISDFILYEGYRNYRPDISDPVKRNTNTYVFVHRMGEFMKTYFRLLGKYPGDYVNAFLAVNAGYLYPWDTSHAHINENGRDTGLGYIQTRWLEDELASHGIHRRSGWNWMFEKLDAFADSNGYLKIPVLRFLLVPGSWLWFFLILAGWLYMHGRKDLLLPLSLIAGYYVTLFLGPTVQLRYIYPVMTALPFLAVYFLDTMKKGISVSEAKSRGSDGKEQLLI